MSFDADDIWEDAATKLQASLAAHGVGGEKSAYIAVAVVDDLRKHWGGLSVYVPQGIAARHRKRNRAIFSEFNGRNYSELALNYELSEMRVRQIISSMTRLEKEKRLKGMSGK